MSFTGALVDIIRAPAAYDTNDETKSNPKADTIPNSTLPVRAGVTKGRIRIFAANEYTDKNPNEFTSTGRVNTVLITDAITTPKVFEEPRFLKRGFSLSLFIIAREDKTP